MRLKKKLKKVRAYPVKLDYGFKMALRAFRKVLKNQFNKSFGKGKAHWDLNTWYDKVAQFLSVYFFSKKIST
jgi:hypothetical protein